MNTIDDLAHALSRLPGIGPRQAKRFVYHLLASPAAERTRLAGLIAALGKEVKQCPECMRFFPLPAGPLRRSGSEASRQAAKNACNYCTDASRDDALLMLVEKDQDLAAVERAGTYRGRYFVLGGVLNLSGKGAIREKELIRTIEKRLAKTAEGGSPGAQSALREIVLALSATSEGEYTADHVRQLLVPYRSQIKISELGRGLATGSELEYSDAETLRAAFSNRHEA